jgi:hypothetical protein
MDYETIRVFIIMQEGEFFARRVELFFTLAVDFAQNKKYNEALIIGNDALTLAKYSNLDYEILYLIGMLCQAYLENDQPEIASDFFKKGMTIIEQGEIYNKDTYANDINSFLDLKIIIDDELKKKNGL